MSFCGVTLQFGDGQAATVKLSTNRPTWRLDDELPTIGREDLEAAIVEALARWSEVCDVVFDKHTNSKTTPTEIITVTQLDGVNGVLADQQLPYGSPPYRMRLDRNERWVIADNPPTGKIELRTVLCHEFGHLLGLQHFPAGGDPELMEPSYNARVQRPQPTEAAYVAKLYGEPRVVTVPGPVPSVPPGVVPQGRVEVTIAGQVWVAAGPLKLKA